LPRELIQHAVSGRSGSQSSGECQPRNDLIAITLRHRWKLTDSDSRRTWLSRFRCVARNARDDR